MVQFETIEEERKDYGQFPGDKFVEVSRNKAIQDDGSENTFIQISQGYYNDEEEPVHTKRFTVPKDQKAVDHIIEKLPEMLDKEKEASQEEE